MHLYSGRRSRKWPLIVDTKTISIPRCKNVPGLGPKSGPRPGPHGRGLMHTAALIWVLPSRPEQVSRRGGPGPVSESTAWPGAPLTATLAAPNRGPSAAPGRRQCLQRQAQCFGRRGGLVGSTGRSWRARSRVTARVGHAAQRIDRRTHSLRSGGCSHQAGPDRQSSHKFSVIYIMSPLQRLLVVTGGHEKSREATGKSRRSRSSRFGDSRSAKLPSLASTGRIAVDSDDGSRPQTEVGVG